MAYLICGTTSRSLNVLSDDKLVHDVRREAMAHAVEKLPFAMPISSLLSGSQEPDAGK